MACFSFTLAGMPCRAGMPGFVVVCRFERTEHCCLLSLLCPALGCVCVIARPLMQAASSAHSISYSRRLHDCILVAPLANAGGTLCSIYARVILCRQAVQVAPSAPSSLTRYICIICVAAPPNLIRDVCIICVASPNQHMPANAGCILCHSMQVASLT